MAIGVLIMGASGSGKSTSSRTLENAGFINCIGKPLPFRNSFKTIATDDAEKIAAILPKCNARAIVIDDAGYVISNFYMRNKAPLTAKMGDKYAVYDGLATGFWKIINAITEAPADKVIYMIMHEDVSDTGMIKPKTIGRMLDDKVCIEGMFSIVLRSQVRDGQYLFKTRTDGVDVCKSPIDMFQEQFIPNDLGMVDKTIREYYGMGIKEEAQQ